jgi:hypothetical protein
MSWETESHPISPRATFLLLELFMMQYNLKECPDPIRARYISDFIDEGSSYLTNIHDVQGKIIYELASAEKLARRLPRVRKQLQRKPESARTSLDELRREGMVTCLISKEESYWGLSQKGTAYMAALITSWYDPVAQVCEDSLENYSSHVGLKHFYIGVPLRTRPSDKIEVIVPVANAEDIS